MKRTHLKRISKKGLEKQKEKRELTKKLHLFMFEWWESFGSYKRCMACNKLLPREFSTANVDHLIEKSKRSDLAFETKNFFLCCLDCHNSKELGFPLTDHKIAIEKAKKELL